MNKLLSLFSILLVCSCVSIPKNQRPLTTSGTTLQAPTIRQNTTLNESGAWVSIPELKRDTVIVRDTIYTMDTLKHFNLTDGGSSETISNGSTTSMGGIVKVDSPIVIKTDGRIGAIKPDSLLPKFRKWGVQAGFQLVGVGSSGLPTRIIPRDTFIVDRVEKINDSFYIFKDSTRQLKALFSLVDSLKVTAVSKSTQAIIDHRWSLFYLWWAIIATVGLLTLSFLYVFRWRY